MPQLVEFPYFSAQDSWTGVGNFIALCRELPDDGMPFKQFKVLLKKHKLWNRDRVVATLRFFRLPGAGVVVPSEVVRSVTTAEDDEAARLVLAERLWECNPLLCKAVIECLQQRVYSRDELYKFVDSFAYRGTPLVRLEMQSWLDLALGLGITKTLGIAMALGPVGEQFVPRAQDVEVEDFLEDDEPEPEPSGITVASSDDSDGTLAPDTAIATPSSVTQSMAGIPTTSRELQISRPVPSPSVALPSTQWTSPHEALARPVPVRDFASGFSKDVLSETANQIQDWFSSQDSSGPVLDIGDFGFDQATWMESSEDTFYQVCVCAALVFRMQHGTSDIIASYKALKDSGVLRDLYDGTAPEVFPEQIDPKSLMLASLVARRCAEKSELAIELEKKKSAKEAFALLQEVLGNGLFRIELFWIMRSLQQLGAVRFKDLQDYTSIPDRNLRDVLFRLGFIDSPYAMSTKDLVVAAKAAHKCVGGEANARVVLSAFSQAAGCGYDCTMRKKCSYPCRERTE